MRTETIYIFEYLDILVAAFAYLKSAAPAQKSVSFEALNEYALGIVSLLGEWDEKAVLDIKKEQGRRVLIEYNQYFEPTKGGIRLKDDVDISKLFREVFADASAIVITALNNDKTGLVLLKNNA